MRLRWALLATHIYDRIPLSNSTYTMASHRLCFAYWSVSPLIKDAALGRIQSHFHFPFDWLRPPAIIRLPIKLAVRLSETPDHYIKRQFSWPERTSICLEISDCLLVSVRLSPPLIHLLLLSSPPPFPSPPFPGHLSLGFPVIAWSTRETGRRSHSSASATPLTSSLPSLATFPFFHRVTFFSELCFFHWDFYRLPPDYIMRASPFLPGSQPCCCKAAPLTFCAVFQRLFQGQNTVKDPPPIEF